jgi:hypothetical protein
MRRPRLATEPGTIPSPLAHELTHAWCQQRLGALGFILTQPVWFREGLATLASGGGGAETVSAEEARAALRAGRRFEPAAWELFFLPHTASRYGLRPRMFYRESALFLAHLHEGDPPAFNAWLGDKAAGRWLGAAFLARFGESLEAAWERFLGGLAQHPAS